MRACIAHGITPETPSCTLTSDGQHLIDLTLPKFHLPHVTFMARYNFNFECVFNALIQHFNFSFLNYVLLGLVSVMSRIILCGCSWMQQIPCLW